MPELTPAEEEARYLKQRHNDMMSLFDQEPDPEPETPNSESERDAHAASEQVGIRPGLQDAYDRAQPTVDFQLMPNGQVVSIPREGWVSVDGWDIRIGSQAHYDLKGKHLR